MYSAHSDTTFHAAIAPADASSDTYVMMSPATVGDRILHAKSNDRVTAFRSTSTRACTYHQPDGPADCIELINASAHGKTGNQ